MAPPHKRLKTRSPFAGKPRTIELRDKNGNLTGFRIYARHIGPIRAQAADITAKLSALGLLVAGLHRLGAQPPGSDLELAVTLLVPLAAWPIFRIGWRWALRTTKVIEIREDVLRINGLFGWTPYNRHLIESYALVPHRRADKESEANQVRAQKLAQKGKFKVLPKYFQESWHVYFVYAGQPIRLMDVYGHEEAQRIQTRLRACDVFMDAQASPGSGPASDPEDDWARAPGGI